MNGRAPVPEALDCGASGRLTRSSSRRAMGRRGLALHTGNKNCSSRSPPAGGSISSLTTSMFSFHTARAHVRLMVKQSKLSLAVGGTHEGAGGRQHSPHPARVDSLPAAVMDRARGPQALWCERLTPPKRKPPHVLREPTSAGPNGNA